MHTAYYKTGWHMLKQNAHCLLQNWVAHVKTKCTMLITELGDTC